MGTLGNREEVIKVVNKYIGSAKHEIEQFKHNAQKSYTFLVVLLYGDLILRAILEVWIFFFFEN